MDQDSGASTSRTSGEGPSNEGLPKRSVGDEQPAEEEETRVITLDTIIRKGLVEQMPMTAKDVNSIVSKSMQKERDRQAADKLRLAALMAQQMESDDDTESSEYDSSNEQDLSTDVVKVKSPVTMKRTADRPAELQKEPFSVIQRAPKDIRSQMHLVDDLKSAAEDPEDFELRSGDLHYSESNPSDYSESEVRLSNSQSSFKKRQSDTRKRDLSPVTGRSVSTQQTEDPSKKQKVDFGTSCTDSKRNAILLQCSAGFGDLAKRSSPQSPGHDEQSSKSMSPPPQFEESNDHSDDRNIDIESMLQVQHSLDDETLHNSHLVIKQERESPVDDVLEIHHIGAFEPDEPIARSGRKSKPKSGYSRSTNSEKKTTIKPVKRLKKPMASTMDVQPDLSLPIIQSVCSTSTSPAQSTTAKSRQIQKRDKRHSIRTNPVYAELSESSSDHIDANLSTPSTSGKSTSSAARASTSGGAPTTSSNPATPKMHWKTQLKIQRQQNESVTKQEHASIAEQALTSFTDNDTNDVTDNNINDTHLSVETVLEDGSLVNRIIEPPHNQKRIPKLKYGSFNFTERRGPGPKMVLKYKRKYKKKTNKILKVSNAVDMLVPTVDSIPELIVTETRPKKTVTIARKPSKAQSQPDETDPGTKAVSANKTGMGNGRSLKEQNQVLMDILEQRSCEVRNLKIRISNILRTNQTTKTFDSPKPLHLVQHVPKEIHIKLEPIESKSPDWSPDELIQAFSLRKLNQTLYAHIQHRYSLPLALPAEIDAYISKMGLESGHLLSNILKVLQCDGEHMSELERVTVLQISQIPLKPSYSYIEKNDVVQHSTGDRMYVILARGLVSKWQHPIYLNCFADNLSNVVKLAITKLNDIQFNVIACCIRFEDGDSNTIWTDLGAGRGYSYFSHPITNDPIYTFYYVDDILRSIHQHLLQNGFKTDIGAKINREPIDALLQKSIGIKTLQSDINDPTRFFSTKTSELLRILQPEHFDTCSDFVDVLAAYQQLVRTEDYGGEHLEHQLQVLSHVQLQLYKIRFDKSSSIPEFKMAITHSIESLKLLQHSMRQKYNVDSFPARSVSEDYLRPFAKAPLYWDSAVKFIRSISFPVTGGGPSVEEPTPIDLDATERSHVQKIIGEISLEYCLADREKFVQDLWRIEEKFMLLWTPLFAGHIHVLRDTLGKVKPSTSLEGSVAFVRRRIELRLNVINALGGVARWPDYHAKNLSLSG